MRERRLEMFQCFIDKSLRKTEKENNLKFLCTATFLEFDKLSLLPSIVSFQFTIILQYKKNEFYREY